VRYFLSSAHESQIEPLFRYLLPSAFESTDYMQFERDDGAGYIADVRSIHLINIAIRISPDGRSGSPFVELTVALERGNACSPRRENAREHR
jgi:hypothetical protein